MSSPEQHLANLLSVKLAGVSPATVPGLDVANVADLKRKRATARASGGLTSSTGGRPTFARTSSVPSSSAAFDATSLYRPTPSIDGTFHPTAPSSGSQSHRATLRETKRMSISLQASGSQTARATAAPSSPMEEKRDDILTVASPASPSAAAPFSTYASHPLPQPVAAAVDAPSTFSFLGLTGVVRKHVTELGPSHSARTYDDELLDVQRENRAREKAKRAVELGLPVERLGTSGGGRPGDEDEKEAGERTRFPRVPGATAGATSTKNDLIQLSSDMGAGVQLPYLNSGPWENATVQIDLASHYTMFADKVADYTHRLTQKLQANLELVRKKIQHNEQTQLQATKHQMRELLRFYHLHEGEMHDTARAVREEERNLKLAELEEEELTRQQQLIHEDYSMQHGQLIGELYQLHANNGKKEQREFLHAHSKVGDSQVARLQAKRESVMQAASSPLVGASDPTLAAGRPPSATLADDSSAHRVAGRIASRGHSRDPSRSGLTLKSPLAAPNSSGETPGAMQLDVEHPTAVGASDDKRNHKRQTSNREVAGSWLASADVAAIPILQPSSRRGSKDGILTPSALLRDSSNRTSRDVSRRSSRRSSRDLPLEITVTDSSTPAELQAHIHLLRTFWQGQFASTRTEREQLKALQGQAARAAD